MVPRLASNAQQSPFLSTSSTGMAGIHCPAWLTAAAFGSNPHRGRGTWVLLLCHLPLSEFLIQVVAGHYRLPSALLLLKPLLTFAAHVPTVKTTTQVQFHRKFLEALAACSLTPGFLILGLGNPPSRGRLHCLLNPYLTEGVFLSHLKDSTDEHTPVWLQCFFFL